MSGDKKSTIFNFIVRYKRKNDGNSPSNREIMAKCKVSSLSEVHRFLYLLEQDGRIERPKKGISKAIKVIGGEWNYVGRD